MIDSIPPTHPNVNTKERKLKHVSNTWELDDIRGYFNRWLFRINANLL